MISEQPDYRRRTGVHSTRSWRQARLEEQFKQLRIKRRKRLEALLANQRRILIAAQRKKKIR